MAFLGFLRACGSFLWRFVRLPAYSAARWLIIIALVVGFVGVIHPPSAFPSKQILKIQPDMTVSEVAQYLKSEHAITSATAFKALVRVFNPQDGVLSGTYYFDAPADVLTVAYRMTHGEYGLSPVALTVPEGDNVFQVAALVARAFPGISADSFVALAAPDEGYLFPDTYYFLPDTSAQEIIDTMRKNFDKKIATIQDKIDAFGKPLSDVVKMASYLEEEARQTQTRRMIAGILWKRLADGMPLQIDSAFAYVNGKNTFQLTTSDLQIDSPYNTYKYKGLTPTPIANPGLDALTDAVTPIDSPYFYFLSDKNGVMHYAVTLAQHDANRAKYLQ